MLWPFTVWINCSSEVKIFENSRPSASNFKSFSQIIKLSRIKKDLNDVTAALFLVLILLLAAEEKTSKTGQLWRHQSSSHFVTTLEQFFLTVGHNNIGNKVQFLILILWEIFFWKNHSFAKKQKHWKYLRSHLPGWIPKFSIVLLHFTNQTLKHQCGKKLLGHDSIWNATKQKSI